ncbi:MAG: clan AA aspartic protease [Blastocatellia bacterium]|nr:clan AA aspartic protease [Blastocatellia bacterium]
MMTGHVNINLEAVLPLSIFGADGEKHEIEAIIDTGYSGFLALPDAFLALLDLTPSGSEQLTLADGSVINTDIYEVIILWEGQPQKLQVDALASESLVGMALLKGYDIHIRAVVGGTVTITPIH